MPAPREDAFSVTDKVVIITGASAGIGADLARGLALAGACVVAGARRLDRLQELAQHTAGKITPVRCDVARDDDRRRLVAQAVETFGRLDGLVNNAAISGSGLPAVRQSTAEFR
jgi:NADP-dependent 3-hydroxy acid dehydrogenase YdfG